MNKNAMAKKKVTTETLLNKENISTEADSAAQSTLINSPICPLTGINGSALSEEFLASL
jgi:hypothetical protein